MDMPVIPTARLKGHVENAYLLLGDRRQIAFPAEILCKALVGRADGKDHGCSVLCHSILAGVLAPHFLCHTERRPRLGPSGIEGGVGQNLSNFLLGDAVFLCAFQMIPEGRIGESLCHERRHRHKRAVSQGKLILPAPYLAEQHIVVQLRELWREIAQSIPTGCLFDCHFYVTSIYFGARSCAALSFLL